MKGTRLNTTSSLRTIIKFALGWILFLAPGRGIGAFFLQVVPTTNTSPLLPASFVRRKHCALYEKSPHSHHHSSSSSQQYLPRISGNGHRIILMRHGESEFNNANIFTGWCDVALTQRGIVEAMEAGEVFRSHELQFQGCYVSLLTRAIVTAQRALEAAGVAYTPLHMDWRLNERHYGALQGLSKERTATRLGRSRVMQWRRSYQARPPLMTPQHPHYESIQQDPRYRHILYNNNNNITQHEKESSVGLALPLGESLEDCQKRVILAWNDIVRDIQQRHDNTGGPSHSLIVAHANTLRALVMHLDDIPQEDIEDLNIPTAIPFFYDIDLSTGQVIVPRETGSFRGTFISDERKKRNFLERRRAANDPWIWALHDNEVSNSMLTNQESQDDILVNDQADMDTIDDIELEEARKNTEQFSSQYMGFY